MIPSKHSCLTGEDHAGRDVKETRRIALPNFRFSPGLKPDASPRSLAFARLHRAPASTHAKTCSQRPTPHDAVHPTVTMSAEPVTSAAASLARNTTAPIISSS